MTDIDAQHFIEELRFDIENNDIIKARLVLSHFEEVDPKTRKLTLFELSKSPDTFVIPLIVRLLADKPELGECRPSLKEILFSKALDYPDTLNRTPSIGCCFARSNPVIRSYCPKWPVKSVRNMP